MSFNRNDGGAGFQRQMFKGDWKCSKCNGPITELPFNPDPSRLDQLLCRDCHRARLSADGKLYTCLFASLGWDVLGAVRAPGFTEADLENFLRRIWQGRLDRYSDDRAEVLASGEPQAKVEMSYIGG